MSCVGGLGTDSYLVNPKRKMFLAVIVAELMGMVISSGIAPFLPSVRIRNHPELLLLMDCDRSTWWLPAPNIWTDGSRDEDLDAMVGVAGAGAFVKNVP